LFKRSDKRRLTTGGLGMDRNKAEINLLENAVYAVRDGALFKLPTPLDGFGKQVVEWEHGKPLKGKSENTFRIK
jgi:hypothetical protein